MTSHAAEALSPSVPDPESQDSGVENWTVAAQPESVAQARHRVVATVRQWDLGLSAALIDALELLTSELVTNACRYAEGEITVTVSAARDQRGTAHQVWVTVEDNSPVGPAVLQAGDDEERGRGMLLVKQLASTWGVRPAGDGKQVWFALDLPSPATLRHATTRTDPLWSTVSSLIPPTAVRSRHRRQVAHA